MNSRIAVFLLFCLCLPAADLNAADPLNVGVGLSKPPYIIQDQNRGAEYEIVHRALAMAGYDMQPKYVPLKRIFHEFKGGLLDAGMTMRAHMDVDGHFSDPVIDYQNFAITRADSGIELSSFEDMAPYSVVAFNNASNLLGDEFKSVVDVNQNYREIANQELQFRMLEAKRTDIVVMDFRIFLHFKKQAEKNNASPLKVKFHNLFPPTPYQVVFRDQKVRDKFDAAMKVIRENGEYDNILRQYISADELKQLY